jgi:hypothetical protein
MQTPSLQPNIHFKLSEQQISTQLNTDTVILNIDTGKYYSLEGVGSSIWQAINEGKNLQEIEQTIMNTFEVSEAQSQKDIYAFINSLQQAGLIKLSSS